MLRISIVVMALAVSATARAERPIRLAAVTGAVDRAAAEAALDLAFGAMAPCFRKPAASIKVQLEVGASGEVTRAAATTRGAAAQCAAGLLAVAAFPAGSAWKATIEVDAISAERWLNAQLGQRQAVLGACQDRDPASKGDVALQLSIAKTGAVTAATVAAATASKPIADCARAAAASIKIDPLPGGLDVKYRMVIAYGGGRGGGGGGGPAGASDPAAPQGTSGGALARGVIQDHWVRQRPSVFACGAKLTRAGQLTVSFRVRADGTVKNVVVKGSTIGNKTVEACVDKATRALTFPAASGETQVSLPIAWGKR